MLLFRALAVVLAVLVCADADELHLNDGTVVRGRLIEQGRVGYVFREVYRPATIVGSDRVHRVVLTYSEQDEVGEGDHESKPGRTVVEDRAKRVEFIAPTDARISRGSTRRHLVLGLRQSYGVDSTLRVIMMTHGSSEPAARVEAILTQLGIESHGPLRSWDAVAPAAPRFAVATVVPHTVGERDVLTGVTSFLHGPGQLVVSFTTARDSWDDQEESIAACLESIEPHPWEPAYIDDIAGVAFYDLPSKATLDPDGTKLGERVAWRVEPLETLPPVPPARAAVSFLPAVDDYQAWLDRRYSGRTHLSEPVSVGVSGYPVSRRIQYDGDQMAVETSIATDDALILVRWSCHRLTFDDHFAASLTRFMDGLVLMGDR